MIHFPGAFSLKRRDLCWGLALILTAWARAEVKVSPAEIDLGRRRQDQTVATTVTLTNAGSGDVKIIRVGADCSCTAATPSKTTLGPGESTELKVSFETHSSQGEVHRRISVLTSDGELIIPLKAVVSAYDNWSFGSAVALFPPTNKGQSAKGNFVITFSGAGSAEITGFSTEATWLQATVSEHHERTWKIELTKAADAPAGNLQPKLLVHTTDRHEPELAVNVFASVYSVLAVRPNPILLPLAKVGQPTSAPIAIAGWEPIDDPRGEIDEGKVTVQQRDHRDVLLSLEVTPKKAGISTRLLRLYAGKGLEAEVPVIVRVEP
jgi:hypothetical protein